MTLAAPALVSADAVLKGWGPRTALGVGSSSGSAPNPVTTGGSTDATGAATNGNLTLLRTPAAVFVTGSGYRGLGHSDDSPQGGGRALPDAGYDLTAFPNTAGVKDVAVGDNFSLIVREDGTVLGWGINEQGQIGTGIVNFVPVTVGGSNALPTVVPGLSDIVQVAAGYRYSLARDGQGRVWSLGLASRLGNSAVTVNSGTPVQVALPAGRKATQITAAYDHALALLDDGTVWAWGANGSGQLGNGTTTAATDPVQVSGLGGLDVTAVTAGRRTSIALLADGSFRAWGDQANGGLGLGNGVTTSQLTAVAPAAGGPNSAYPAFSQISAVGYTTYAIVKSGSFAGRVYAWGSNQSRGLGADATNAFPFGSGNAITSSSNTEIPQAVPRTLNVGWLTNGGGGNGNAAQLVVSDTVLRPFGQTASNQSFYTHQVGTTSATQIIGVQSGTGNQADQASTITSVSIGGPHADDFQLLRGNETGAPASDQAPAVTFPYAIPGLSALNLRVRFVPTGLGERNAYLQVDAAEGESIRLPLDGYGVALTGKKGEQGDPGIGAKGEKGDTVTVAVPVVTPGGTISVAATRSVTTVRRGKTAKLPFLLLNGSGQTLTRSTATASVPKALRSSGKRTATTPSLRSGASGRFSVPVTVGKRATLGSRKVKVAVKVAGKTITRTVTVRVKR